MLHLSLGCFIVALYLHLFCILLRNKLKCWKLETGKNFLQSPRNYSYLLPRRSIVRSFILQGVQSRCLSNSVLITFVCLFRPLKFRNIDRGKFLKYFFKLTTPRPCRNGQKVFYTLAELLNKVPVCSRRVAAGKQPTLRQFLLSAEISGSVLPLV